jgi:hypothetical protein
MITRILLVCIIWMILSLFVRAAFPSLTSQPQVMAMARNITARSLPETRERVACNMQHKDNTMITNIPVEPPPQDGGDVETGISLVRLKLIYTQ